MYKNYLLKFFMPLIAFGLLVACSDSIANQEEDFDNTGQGVFVLCEGNYQSGNSTLSYYHPESGDVENGVFYRANDRKLGDTGQSITLHNGVAYIAVENSSILWAIDTETFKVRGQLTTGDTEHMINPRYVHIVSDTKAYVTDLYSPYITMFNPKTLQYIGSISTGQPANNGYSSTERMVQYGKYVFTNCWCYSRNILVIDSENDVVCDSIVLSSWQPKSMTLDANGKLWVLTDGGYTSDYDSFGDNTPHLYRIDAETRTIEQDWAMDSDEASVALDIDPTGTILYLINNDIYRMSVTENHPPVRPFINAPTDSNGTRHKLYGMGIDPHNGDIYIADAVDYRQSGTIYRYNESGVLVTQFRVGINPNGFAFK